MSEAVDMVAGVLDKQSGIGREMGAAGLEEHLELKTLARPAT